MRFMVFVKATKSSEAGEMPSEQLRADMQKYNEALAKAGVLLAGEGLQPSFPGMESEVEIRQVFEAEDFGPEFTPELREAEERLRAQIAAKS